jgi:transglutaminase-like putative cysteine protease
MTLLRPLPRRLTRAASALVLVAWVVSLGLLVRRTLEAATLSLGGDLSAYGASAQWKGIYSRGEKIGYLVGQTTPREDGYELTEDGQLQMTLLGAATAARLRTSALVDREFRLRSFTFTLDPGTGPIAIGGRVEGTTLHLTVRTPGGERTETRTLAEPPALALNLSRRMAAAGLRPGLRLETPVFDPATLRNATMVVEVDEREVVRAAGRPVPAFRTRTTFGGIASTSWITDVGEVVKEESPLGFLVVRETRERALSLAVSNQVQRDLYDAAAIVPETSRARIDDPASVVRLRVRLTGADLASPDVQGDGQRVSGDVIELVDTKTLRPAPATEPLDEYLRPEVFLESDAPEIVAEARKAVQGVEGNRARAERLVRYVNDLLEKKPTVSLPSALEVLRTRVGDCNEHTALYAAMARSLGLPSRIAVGLVFLRGAFYYHAWPEVFVAEGDGRGVWLPVDPTLNQFPADPTHIRLARGGLDKQAAILGLIGRAKLTVLDLDTLPGTERVMVGNAARQSAAPLDLALPPRRRGCWSWLFD